MAGKESAGEKSIRYGDIACFNYTYTRFLKDIRYLDELISTKDKYKNVELASFSMFRSALFAVIELVDEEHIKDFSDMDKLHDYICGLIDKVMMVKDDFKAYLKERVKNDGHPVKHECKFGDIQDFAADDKDDEKHLTLYS
jgi:hypothetical protein